jgi:hypothetical protein
VYVDSTAVFTKTSGTIYGKDAAEGLKNTASADNYGHAVYVNAGSPLKRDNTAGPGAGLVWDPVTPANNTGWE